MKPFYCYGHDRFVEKLRGLTLAQLAEYVCVEVADVESRPDIDQEQQKSVEQLLLAAKELAARVVRGEK